MKSQQFIRIVLILVAMCCVRFAAYSQQLSAKSASCFRVPGVYSGTEPRFKMDDGSRVGPTKTEFHFLPGGKAFIDWARPQTPESGRTFGTYEVRRDKRGLKIEARFIPSMDSAATQPPQTDFFETYRFRCSNGRLRGRLVEEENAPTFVVSSPKGKTLLRRPQSTPETDPTAANRMPRGTRWRFPVRERSPHFPLWSVAGDAQLG